MLLLALALRALAAWWLGPGPFGPDGAGAEAAATLGGHPYPLHPALIRLVGDGRVVSVLGGVLAVWAAGRMGARLGADRRASGLLAACAPLLLLTASMAGGDAAATGVAGAGVALAWSGAPLLGGLLAASSVAIKPVALPLLPLLLLSGRFPGAPRAATARTLVGLALGILPWMSTLDPLLRPRPAAGLLGSWWRSTQDLPPNAENWTEPLTALRALYDLPLHTGLHALALLALLGVARAEHRKLPALALALSLLAILAPAALLGEQLRPRYLAAASLPLTALAGLGLRGFAPVGLLFLWPAFAFVSQLAALRSSEESLPPRPVLRWPAIDVRDAYRDAGVCGAGELRAMADTLAAELPQGATVGVLRLRDGREGELRWPLLTQRPDLRIALLHAGSCPDGACVADLSGPVVYLSDASRCATEVIDPGEAPIAARLVEDFGASGGVYGLHK